MLLYFIGFCIGSKEVNCLFFLRTNSLLCAIQVLPRFAKHSKKYSEHSEHSLKNIISDLK